MKKNLFAALLALVLALVCTCSIAFAEDTAPAEPERLSVTTGLPTNKDYTPYLVQVDNATGARPQVGFSYADVIYECEIQNGGTTRYTLLFNDTMAEKVEPVRSARIMHADIALDWNATLIHWGGQKMRGTNVYDYMSQNDVSHIDGIGVGRSLFYRDSKRTAPHNVLLLLSELTQDNEYARTAEPKSPLKFSADAFTQTGTDVTDIEIIYSKGCTPSYTFNPENGLYYRSYNGKEQLDGATKEQVTVTNIVVMTVDYEYYNWEGDRPVVEFTGKNDCKFFINGKYIEGIWARKTTDKTTRFFDKDGQEILFKPGRTAIQVVRADKRIEMK